MRFIDGDLLRSLVPMERAIDAVDAAFRARDDDTPSRRHFPIGEDSELLFMPSWNPRAAGVKLITVTPGNVDRGVPLINGAYLAFDRETLQPAAVIDASALTAIRTAAVSGVATRALADPRARRLVIFGAGVQAHSHLEAMIRVRPISEVGVVSRSEGPARALVEAARRLGVKGELLEAPEAVAGADIVCTCTTSSEPVFRGYDLNPGAHLNAVGAYRTESRELDSETVRRAALIVVETPEAMWESGDLSVPLRAGQLDPKAPKELGDVLDRTRPSYPEITLFKSVGRAFEDLAVVEAALAALD